MKSYSELYLKLGESEFKKKFNREIKGEFAFIC